MGLRYGTSRSFITLFLLIVIYFIALPTYWSGPTATIELPPSSVYGNDLPLKVTIRSWHSKYSVRHIRFAINNVGSSAFIARDPLLPINLLSKEAAKSWSVGILDRATFPRKRSFELTIPLSELARKRQIGPGTLSGRIDVEIDYTKVTMSAGYPLLTVLRNIPFDITIRR